MFFTEFHTAAVTGPLTITDDYIHSHRFYYFHFITTAEIIVVVKRHANFFVPR